MSGVYWGAGKDSKYSGARRGIGASGTPRGCREPFGGVREVRGIRGVLGLAETLGTQRPEVVWGIRGIGGS